MGYHQIVIVCRDNEEGDKIKSAIGQPSIPLYHRASPLLDHLANSPDCFLVLTPLIIDETAIGLLTKCAIDSPVYSILYAVHTERALNILRLFGCGCAHIFGPDELSLLPPKLNVEEDELLERVFPPFFIQSDESELQVPSTENAKPLHVSFLGKQALMSCCNALIHLSASNAISMSCVAPSNAWALEQLKKCLAEYTLWTMQTKPIISNGSVTMCQDFKALASLEPASQHFIVCHGQLSEKETQYLERQPDGTQIFTASDEGYFLQKKGSSFETVVPPEKMLNSFISSLYTNE